MTATPQRESEGIWKGELKDAKWELQRCGILLEGSGEGGGLEGGLQKVKGKQGRYSDGGKRIYEALGSAMHALEMMDGGEVWLKFH